MVLFLERHSIAPSENVVVGGCRKRIRLEAKHPVEAWKLDLLDHTIEAGVLVG